jgi:hypothetical protein
MTDINLDDVKQITFPDGQTHIDLGYKIKSDNPVDILRLKTLTYQ